MDKVKYCPLKTQRIVEMISHLSGDGELAQKAMQCDGDECAWWTGSCCAVLAIASNNTEKPFEQDPL